MAYQALLFCPDDKTTRTVTQVLSELDFAVAPCTEPFAAVKRLMAEHFDAVVVDCDNEQNATLLFKSAHNSAHNQSSLAVAVVEGQAGVAKAFRIGANLVLTKPINVEQAKGTLRVARGLLRKGEAAKAAGPSAGAPAPAMPAAPKAAPRPIAPTTSVPRTATPMVPAARATPKPWIPAAAPVAAADSTPVVDAEAEEEVLGEIDEPTPAPAASTKPSAGVHDSGVVKSTVREKIASTPAVGTAASSSGAASAPARAAETKLPATLPEPSVDKETEEDLAALRAASEAEAPSFTFGGNAVAEASGGRKKAPLAIVAVLVLAAAGYAAWTHFQGGSSAPASAPAALRPATPPATSTPSPSGIPPGTTASAPATAAPSTPAATSTEPVMTGTSSSAADAQPANTEEEQPATHSASRSSERPSHAASAPVSKASAPTKPAAQPIVVKSGFSTPVAATPTAVADVPAPNPLAMTAAGNGGLPNLTANEANAPKPVLQTVSVSQGVSQGLVYKKVQPVYPSSALRMRVEGDVELLATISAHGDITSVKIVSGTPVLAHAAADAVKQWKYKPYLLDGKPVDIQTQITVKFKLPQ